MAASDREGRTGEEEIQCCNMLVVEGKESLEVSGRQGLTPLMVAARAGKVELVGWMCDMGAGVDRREAQGWTALIFSVDTGHGDVSRLLLERG